MSLMDHSKVGGQVDDRMSGFEKQMRAQVETMKRFMNLSEEQSRMLSLVVPIDKYHSYSTAFTDAKASFVKVYASSASPDALSISSEHSSTTNLNSGKQQTQVPQDSSEIIQQIQDFSSSFNNQQQQYSGKLEEALANLGNLDKRTTEYFSKFEDLALKVKYATYAIDNINDSLEKKAIKAEVKKAIDELKSIQLDLQDDVGQFADKQTVKDLAQRLSEQEMKLQDKLTIGVFEELLEMKITKFRTDLMKSINTTYESKIDAKLMHSQINAASSEIKLGFITLREDLTSKLEAVDMKCADLKEALSSKVSNEDFEEYKAWERQFVHWSSLSHVFETTLPLVKTCEKETLRCASRVNDFQVFLNKVDEAVLNKCEKMEVLKIKNDLQSTLLTKESFAKSHDVLVATVKDLTRAFDKLDLETTLTAKKTKELESTCKVVLQGSIGVAASNDSYKAEMEEIEQSIRRLLNVVTGLEMEIGRKAETIDVANNTSQQASFATILRNELVRSNQRLSQLASATKSFIKLSKPHLTSDPTLPQRKKELATLIEAVSEVVNSAVQTSFTRKVLKKKRVVVPFETQDGELQFQPKDISEVIVIGNELAEISLDAFTTPNASRLAHKRKDVSFQFYAGGGGGGGDSRVPSAPHQQLQQQLNSSTFTSPSESPPSRMRMTHPKYQGFSQPLSYLLRSSAAASEQNLSPLDEETMMTILPKKIDGSDQQRLYDGGSRRQAKFQVESNDKRTSKIKMYGGTGQNQQQLQKQHPLGCSNSLHQSPASKMNQRNPAQILLLKKPYDLSATNPL